MGGNLAFVRLPPTNRDEGLPPPALNGHRARRADSAEMLNPPGVGRTAPLMRYLSAEQIPQIIARDSLLSSQSSATLSVNGAIQGALLHSKRIHVQRLLPRIEHQRIGEAIGQFDWAVFVDNLVRDSEQRIESLDSQNDVFAGRFQSRVGVRKDTRLGGALELSERVRSMDRDQTGATAQSQFRIRFSQELLRDRGRSVAESEVLIANLMTESQDAASTAQITNVLLEVSDTYWKLYQARGRLAVHAHLLQAAKRILAEMETRQELDVEESLIAQATAAVFNRHRDFALAQAEVRRMQDAMQRLMNDERLDSNFVELVTSEPAVVTPIAEDPQGALAIAFQHREEIRSALQNIEIAQIDRQVATNQVLPQLTLILEAQFTGVDSIAMAPPVGSSPTDDSVYGGWLNFEYPLNNRQRKSAQRRAELTFLRQQSQFEDVVEQVSLDVKGALRTLTGNGQAIELARLSVEQSLKELAYRETRRNLAPRRNALASVTLDQLLRAQRRLGEAQIAYVESVVRYNQALMQLRRATGQLVEATRQ
ncbi:MAG: TolC family protein [Pirellulaceae bacterium]|jgi:outer membrane protein TolC|nr:TolC family protein [Pirellulaceae bacterium]